MGELAGVLIAIVSSCLGGTAAAVTRYLVGNADALTLAILRWGIGFLFVLPMALVLRAKWPPRSDWFGVRATFPTAVFDNSRIGSGIHGSGCGADLLGAKTAADSKNCGLPSNHP